MRRQLKDAILGIKEIVSDIILPRTCFGCGKEGKYVCEQCDLFLSEAPNLFQQGDLEELFSAWEYDGLIKNIILEIKYKGMFDAIDELVEKVLSTPDVKFVQHLELDAITFVPMFKKKEKQRGFNQAELIANKLGEMTGGKMLSLLEKVKDTSSQTKLDKTERAANVKGSFSYCLTSEVKQVDNVLLVDDVWTSGSTMKECARVLKKSGAKRIFGFTIARTV